MPRYPWLSSHHARAVVDPSMANKRTAAAVLYTTSNTADLPAPVMAAPVVVAIVEAGAIVIRIVSCVVPINAGTRHVVHVGFIVVAVARLIVPTFDDTLALDNARWALNIGLALFVPTQVRCRSRARSEPYDAEGGNSAEKMSHW
jgi:hypothetical protein